MSFLHYTLGMPLQNMELSNSVWQSEADQWLGILLIWRQELDLLIECSRSFCVGVQSPAIILWQIASMPLLKESRWKMEVVA